MGEIEELLGLAFQFEPDILVLLVARDAGDALHEIEDRARRMAFVGEHGINDLRGFALRETTLAQESRAIVVIASDDPRAVLSIIELSRAAYRKMVQNLWWAAGYNLVSVPLAAGVLAPVGISMPMEVGALLMSASTILVALNAQLLRRVDLTPR